MEQAEEYISTHDLTKRSTEKTGEMGVGVYISTHDLTKRSTGRPLLRAEPSVISTHDLTKRSTPYTVPAVLAHMYFNSRPHEEVDQNHLLIKCDILHFNSRPHEEVDGPVSCLVAFLNLHFNSRPHEEVDDQRLTDHGRANLISTHDLTKRSTDTWDV